MKLNRKTSPRLFQEECLAVWIYDRKRSGGITASPSELNEMLAKWTFRNENWWALKLRNVASVRGDSPPSGNDRNMAEISRAEALRVSDPSQTVSESMGAFKIKPTEQDFAALFGEAVPYAENVERIGAPAQPQGSVVQLKPLSTYLDEYKAYVEGGAYDELYKWQIAKTVQDNWDLEAQDLEAMIERSFNHQHQNLWSGQNFLPKRMLLGWAKRDAEDCRLALRELIYGVAPLADRMRAYAEHAKRNLQAARPDEDLSTYQDTRAMSLWLGMVLPEKYYLYKSSTVTGFIQRTGHAPLAKPGDKYTNIDAYYGLCEEVRGSLLTRPDIIEAHRAIRDASCHTDPEHHLLVQDIIYFVGEHEGLNNEGMDTKEEDFINTLRYYGLDDQRIFLAKVEEVLRTLGVTKADERITYSCRDGRVLALTIGQRYCLVLASGERGRIGFISPDKGHEQDVNYGKFEGPAERWFGSTNNWSRVQENWSRVLEATRAELARTKASGFRKHSNPFFEKAVFDTGYRASILGGAQPTSQETTAVSNRHPLNTIFYGPPGTGKTYALKDRYFERFTTHVSALTREQRLTELVQELSWWEVAAMVLLDIGPSKTTSIIDHELLRIKAGLSKSANVRATVWGTLQGHTVNECELVKYANRLEPLIFNKREDSIWEVLPNSDTDVVAELQALLDQSKRNNDQGAREVKRYEFVTFHQSFSYEDFIEGIKPNLNGNEVAYEIVSGVFKQLCAKAEQDPDNGYAIFIDEINRGNVSAIFGELITLIEADKRAGMPNALSVVLPYSKTVFSVPRNLHIIGTMNTADRSVEALDSALRRRFNFEECPSRPEDLKNRTVNGVDLTRLLHVINARIEMLLDRDHHIGHSYFMNWTAADPERQLRQVFKNNIIPLLQEYFYGDPVKVGMVLGPAFVQELQGADHQVQFAKGFKAGEDIEPRPRYAFTDPTDPTLVPLQAFLDICDGK